MVCIGKLTSVLAAGAFSMLPIATWPAVPAALHQPAMQSSKSLNAAMLAVARAGKRLIVVGERGIILLSDDGGNRWQQAQVPVRTSLTAVQFVNDKTGWAVGHLGVVLHTADGGKTWVKQLDGIQAADLALQAAKQVAARNPGQDKAVADAARLVADGPDKPFLDVYFENERTGYVVGAYNLIFKTVDGGKSWQSWQSHVVNPKGFHLYGIRAAGSALYLVGEQGTLLRSTDQGESFAALDSPYKGTYFGMVAVKSGELIVFGLRGNAFRSEDQGNSWQKIDTRVQTSIAAGIELDNGALVLVSQVGDVLVSRDKGRSFTPQKGVPLPLAAVAQATDKNLVVAGLRGVKLLPAP